MHLPGQEDALVFLNRLNGETVSLTWRGAGTAIFLEIGPLIDEQHRKGQATIGVEWSWRIEKDSKILLGSFNEDGEIEEFLSILTGEVIDRIGFFGQPPELLINFESGLRLASFATVGGDPQWSVNVGDAWVSFQSGRFVYESSST